MGNPANIICVGKMLQLMTQIAGDSGIAGGLNALAHLVMGHLGRQRDPCLADLPVENGLDEIRINNRPEPLMRRLRMPVQLNKRIAQHRVGPAEHRLEKRALILKVMQDDTL